MCLPTHAQSSSGAPSLRYPLRVLEERSMFSQAITLRGFVTDSARLRFNPAAMVGTVDWRLVGSTAVATISASAIAWLPPSSEV